MQTKDNIESVHGKGVFQKETSQTSSTCKTQ